MLIGVEGNSTSNIHVDEEFKYIHVYTHLYPYLRSDYDEPQQDQPGDRPIDMTLDEYMYRDDFESKEEMANININAEQFLEDKGQRKKKKKVKSEKPWKPKKPSPYIGMLAYL